MEARGKHGGDPVRTVLPMAVALLIVLILASCGYRFTGEETRLDPGLKTVFVDIFTNRTGEAYAENIFRAAFINRFVQEGRFTLASGRGEADVILRGSVRSLRASPLAYKAGDLAAENRLAVTLELNLDERLSGRNLWSDTAFTATADYAVTTVNLAEAGRKNALTKLANDAAERAYRLMMSGF
jgi:hypothetical protein